MVYGPCGTREEFVQRKGGKNKDPIHPVRLPVDGVRKAAPDLVLLDWDLPGQPPANVVAEVASTDPRPRIIVLGKDAGDRQVALAAGADGSVVKGDPPQQLLLALRQLSSQS